MSFIKKGAVKPTELGTRPGLSGQTLVSTGLAEFDKLLGGGLPLKTVTLLLEDSYTQHHLTLLKYFLAEGAANKQALHWSAGHDSHSSDARTLPQQVNHVPKEDAKDKQQESEEVQLRIAWQYRRYIKSKQKAAADTRSMVAGKTKAKTGTAPLGSVRDWCHNYDLTKPTSLQDLSRSRAESSSFSGPEATQNLVVDVRSFISSLAQPSLESSASQQQQQDPSNVPRGVHPPLSQAPQTPFSSITALGTSDSKEGCMGRDKTLLTGSTAAASAARPRSSAYSGSSLREQPAVSASQHAHFGRPSNTQHSAAGNSPVDRLRPSDASQSTSPLTHDTSQNGASLVRPAGLPYPEPPTSNGDSSAGNSSVKAQGVGRVGWESLGGLAWQLEGSDAEVEKQIYVAVFQLKAMIRDSRCAAMVSLPAGLYSSSLTARLAHLCDTVVGLEAVRDDSDIVRVIPEPASCCGLLHLQKLPSLNALGPPILDMTLFIIRHKRRRLAIQAVQIDPDAEAGETDTKSAAAALCGGPPKAEKAFDF